MPGLPRRVRWSLLGWSLLIAALGAASPSGFAEIASCETSPSKPDSQPASAIVLTAAKPVVRIPIPIEVWREKRTSLAISIVAIKNPKDTALFIDVTLDSLTESEVKAKIAPARIGVLGIYPAGQTGSYRLETSTALRQVQASRGDTNHLCLRMELRRVHSKEPLAGLEVTLSAPKWLPAI